jgi:hypothetical protein
MIAPRFTAWAPRAADLVPRSARLALVALGLAARAHAQDFSSPAPPGAGFGAAPFIERGLPAPAATPALEALAANWYGVPELSTRALALGGGWRSLRAAAGIAQTGDGELGWSAAGLAIGAAGGHAGGGLRAIARRDRDEASEASALGRGAGAEAGGGAWVRAGGGTTVYASAPQLWRRGLDVPVGRGLEIGATWIMDDLAFRLDRVAPRGGAEAAQHEAALALAAGSLRLWLGARDQPLRASLGLGARTGPIAIAGEVESHPVLGETVRVAVALSSAAP